MSKQAVIWEMISEKDHIILRDLVSHETIAIVPGCDEKAHQNARLIATSSYVVDATKELIGCIEKQRNQLADCNDLIEKAKIAIMVATGRAN